MSTPKYRVDLFDHRGFWDKLGLSWNVRSRTNVHGDGKPTDANLEKKVFAYAKSLELGGVNEHLSKAAGFIPYPKAARIVNQFTGEVVAEWKAGMFQVF